MNGKKIEATCPFQGVCRKWDPSTKSCGVKREKPVIFCSLCEFPPETVPLDAENIGKYLDRHISFWETKAQILQTDYAQYFAAAYQKVRKALLGRELQIPAREKKEAESD